MLGMDLKLHAQRVETTVCSHFLSRPVPVWTLLSRSVRRNADDGYLATLF